MKSVPQTRRGFRYSVAHVFSALGPADARRLHGCHGAEPGSFSVSELVRFGVSDEGIGLVIGHSEVDGAISCEEEPGVVTPVLLQDAPDPRKVCLLSSRSKTEPW